MERALRAKVRFVRLAADKAAKATGRRGSALTETKEKPADPSQVQRRPRQRTPRAYARQRADLERAGASGNLKLRDSKGPQPFGVLLSILSSHEGRKDAAGGRSS